MPHRSADSLTLENPLRISPRYLADPCVFRERGCWYAIGTSSHHPDARGIAYREPDGATFGVHASDHLLDEPWQYRGGLLEPLDLPQHWAPELVLTPNGRPYRDARGELSCLFSAGTNHEHWIYLATSTDMETRFRVRRRLMRGTDPHPHFDERGDLYLIIHVTTLLSTSPPGKSLAPASSARGSTPSCCRPAPRDV